MTSDKRKPVSDNTKSKYHKPSCSKSNTSSHNNDNNIPAKRSKSKSIKPSCDLGSSSSSCSSNAVGKQRSTIRTADDVININEVPNGRRDTKAAKSTYHTKHSKAIKNDTLAFIDSKDKCNSTYSPKKSRNTPDVNSNGPQILPSKIHVSNTPVDLISTSNYRKVNSINYLRRKRHFTPSADVSINKESGLEHQTCHNRSRHPIMRKPGQEPPLTRKGKIYY